MARKGWDSLSEAYRKRLIKGGISRAEYEAGASIKKARGHADTPERPVGYQPSKYPKYADRRQGLERRLQQRKEELFGSRPKWKVEKSLANIRSHPATMAQLRWALAAEEDELWDAIRDIHDHPENAFLGYS